MTHAAEGSSQSRRVQAATATAAGSSTASTAIGGGSSTPGGGGLPSHYPVLPEDIGRHVASLLVEEIVRVRREN